MPSRSWQFKTLSLPESLFWCFPTYHLFYNSQTGQALLISAWCPSLMGVLGQHQSQRSRAVQGTTRLPASQKLEIFSCFFLLFLLEWLHWLSLLVPTLLLSNYFQPQRSSADMVTGFFCMWLIFLPFFFSLNKHTHFPIFPSPNSLASFPLHKRRQETRSVKQCAAFLNNCVTTWNGTCESFKNLNVH